MNCVQLVLIVSLSHLGPGLFRILSGRIVKSKLLDFWRWSITYAPLYHRGLFCSIRIMFYRIWKTLGSGRLGIKWICYQCPSFVVCTQRERTCLGNSSCEKLCSHFVRYQISLQSKKVWSDRVAICHGNQINRSSSEFRGVEWPM